MAKSLRSKIMRRWRKLRRDHVDNIIVKDKNKKIFQNNLSTLAGIEFREKEKKNAFLHPDDPEAQFPQFVPAPIVDLRSSAIPGSGREWSGANRKNKTITQDFNYQLGEEQKVIGVVQQKPDENEMKEQKPVANVSYKIKKTRKSKLRKTIVF